MGKIYTHATIWEKNIVEIIHMFGGRCIFLLFCVHQDTESE